MSSLIEVLKQIQDKEDLESRTEARTRFGVLSHEFETKMAVAYGTGYDNVKGLAAAEMMMAEYWMNQWVGSDPQWHGDWGKALRQAVREIKAYPASGIPTEPISWSGDPVPVLTDEEVDAAIVQRDGTVKIGRNELPAWKDGAGVVHYETKTGVKLATDRVAKSFKLA